MEEASCIDPPDKDRPANWHGGCGTMAHWRFGAACNL